MNNRKDLPMKTGTRSLITAGAVVAGSIVISALLAGCGSSPEADAFWDAIGSTPTSVEAEKACWRIDDYSARVACQGRYDDTFGQ